MAVLCSNCGEELLGAVNRCWKCGSPFAAPPSSDAPPVRRPPVSLTAQPAVSAPVVTSAENPSPAEVLASSILAEPVDGQPTPVAAAAAAPPRPAPARRRGSPFADSHTAGQRPRAPASATPRATPYRPAVDYARHSAATGGAVASLLLGILGLCGSYYIPSGALITALLGIGMGLWGLYSDRRGLAIAGLVFCCLTLVIAGFFGAIELFTYINGYRPWETDPELRPDPTL